MARALTNGQLAQTQQSGPHGHIPDHTASVCAALARATTQLCCCCAASGAEGCESLSTHPPRQAASVRRYMLPVNFSLFCCLLFMCTAGRAEGGESLGQEASDHVHHPGRPDAVEGMSAGSGAGAGGHCS
jgi:hypothetical protein